VAPFNRDSGRIEDAVRLPEAGPPHGRPCTWPLWWPPFRNPRLRPFYQHLIAAGKVPKVALGRRHAQTHHPAQPTPLKTQNSNPHEKTVAPK